MQAPSSLHLTTLPVSATKPATSIELYSNVHTTLCNCLYCMFHVCNFRYLFLHYFVANQLSWYIIFFHVRSYVTNVKDKLNQIKFLNLLRHLTTGALGCLTLNTHKIIAKIKKNKKEMKTNRTGYVNYVGCYYWGGGKEVLKRWDLSLVKNCVREVQVTTTCFCKMIFLNTNETIANC